MRHARIGRAFGALAACCAAGGAGAASALAVDPPAGYVAAPAAPGGAYAEAVAVMSARDADAGCKIGFQPSGPAGGVDQAALNATAATPGYRAIVRDALAPAYEIARIESVSVDGVRGFVIAGRPRGAPQRVQSRLYILETPVGRTSVSCVAGAGQMARRAAEFDAVARGVHPPR